MIVLRCLTLAAILHGDTLLGQSAPYLGTFPPDTNASTDTATIPLSMDLLTRVAHVIAEIQKDPKGTPAWTHVIAHDSVHFRLNLGPFVGMEGDASSRADSSNQGQLVSVLNLGAAAAQVPGVAAAFKRAQLAPASYLPVIRSLALAEANDTIVGGIEGMTDDPVTPTHPEQRVWANVAFLQAHRDVIDALDIPVPKLIMTLNDGAQADFLDTVAWAKHILRINQRVDTSTGFRIGFLDSTDVAAGGGADPSAPPLHILFIGNSLSYFNAMPKIFSALAAQGLRRRVVVGLVSVPGASPFMLWAGTDVRRVIEAFPWDDVVIQMKPGGSNTAKNFQRYARVFAQAAALHHSRVVLWTEYPDPDTPPESQTALDTTLAGAARAVGAMPAPVPAAWRNVQQADDTTFHALYYDLPNGNHHPSAFGSYLISLVLYRTITGQSPIGLPHHAGSASMSDHVATVLQNAAAR